MVTHVANRTEIEQEILELFRNRTRRSAEDQAAASRVLPGGDTRTVAFHAPYPLTIVEGQGSRIVDADGHEYLDFLNNYTSLIHGHAHPATITAVTKQLGRGTAFPARHPAQTQLATLICERVASVDLVRFCNSGTEAVMNAIRAARAFTGREVILKMEGGYHGTYDDVEVSVHPDLTTTGAGEAHAPRPVIDSQGVPANTTVNVLVTPLNDIAAAERTLTERGDTIAAVIIEPVMGAGGMIPASTAFLERLRALTIEHGCLLIFDEVMSFRLETGGMQDHHRVRPDLTTFAKIIGGGFPVGAFGGRAAVMEQFNPTGARPLSQSGTFNGNVITMVAGIAAMEEYTRSEVEQINRLGDELRDALRDGLASASVPGTVTGYGSFVGLHLTTGPVTNYREAAATDRSLQRLMHIALLLEGVFCAPRLMWCTSTAMGSGTIHQAAAAFVRALYRIRPAFDD